MPSLKLFNSLTRQKETFTPRIPGKVSLYTCGPTVYDFAHIGNFRTYVFEDLLRRTLAYFGLQVTHVMNLTDVDDKTIRGALKKNISLDAYTQPFKEAFFSDLAALRIQRADHYPEATAYIDKMIELIQILLDKKIAYRTEEGSVYFAIHHFPSYGKLCHLCQEDMKKGAGVSENDEYDKESVSDFALWKAYDKERDGEIFWESPFGKGRPGWHIECSAMAMALLGEQLDIHVGGVDNLFPHHENEIAQSEGCTGKKFVNYWLHAEHLLVDHKKMSKSLGNFYTLRDLLHKGYTGVQVRYMLLQTHYRTQLNFTFAGLDGAKASLDRLWAFVKRMQEVQLTTEPLEFQQHLEEWKQRFDEGLADDLNISISLSALFDAVKQINIWCDQGQFGKKSAEEVLKWLSHCDEVLNCLFIEDSAIPEHLQQLLQQRIAARASKNWALADTLRQQIQDAGYVIEDGAAGARLKKL